MDTSHKLRQQKEAIETTTINKITPNDLDKIDVVTNEALNMSVVKYDQTQMNNLIEIKARYKEHFCTRVNNSGANLPLHNFNAKHPVVNSLPHRPKLSDFGFDPITIKQEITKLVDILSSMPENVEQLLNILIQTSTFEYSAAGLTYPFTASMLAAFLATTVVVISSPNFILLLYHENLQNVLNDITSMRIVPRGINPPNPAIQNMNKKGPILARIGLKTIYVFTGVACEIPVSIYIGAKCFNQTAVIDPTSSWGKIIADEINKFGINTKAISGALAKFIEDNVTAFIQGVVSSPKAMIKEWAKLFQEIAESFSKEKIK
jgi:hypothetical protein